MGPKAAHQSHEERSLDLIKFFIDAVLHLDHHLAQVVARYGGWTYGILFGIVFCETGLVVTPFLPGDSLLFAAGALCAASSLDVVRVLVFLSAAAILGDTVNYWAGAWAGPKVFSDRHARFLNRKHLERTHRFYEKYGGKTILIARFVPIVRTFAPFVAGIGRMSYWRFIAYNIGGGIAWVLLCVLGGYFFGNLPFVQKNFSVVILAIIFLSILPAAIEVWRQRSASPQEPAAPLR